MDKMGNAKWEFQSRQNGNIQNGNFKVDKMGILKKREYKNILFRCGDGQCEVDKVLFDTANCVTS